MSKQEQPDIYYYDRADQQVKRETVYGERFVKWAYQDGRHGPVQRFIFRSALPSKVLGWYFDSWLSRRRVVPAIEQLEIDTAEFRDPVSSYGSFNAFFTRHLKGEARPYPAEPQELVSPADGRTLVYPCTEADMAVPAKGAAFTVRQLLQRETPDFDGGVVYVIRLCPADYHRFHFPCDGRVIEQWTIDGAYHSVNPIALAAGFRVFTENRRSCCLIDSARFGQVAYIEVGAFGVGSIVQTYAGADVQISKMDEKGYFKFGGSTIILALQKGAVAPSADLLEQSAAGRETLVKVGQSLGTAD